MFGSFCFWHAPEICLCKSSSLLMSEATAAGERWVELRPRHGNRLSEDACSQDLKLPFLSRFSSIISFYPNCVNLHFIFRFLALATPVLRPQSLADRRRALLMSTRVRVQLRWRFRHTTPRGVRLLLHVEYPVPFGAPFRRRIPPAS